MSIPARLRSFAALPGWERGLVLRALGYVTLLRLMLRWRPAARWRRWIDRRSGVVGAPRHDREFALGVRRAIDRAARSQPGATCLPLALAGEVLLRRAGVRADLRIGVAPTLVLGAVSGVDAHAWLTSGDVLVTGDAPELDRYAVLLEFADGTPVPRA